MDTEDDPIDRALKDKYRALNLWAEIGARRGSDPGEDRRNLISGKVMRAKAMLDIAAKEKCSYSEVIDFVTDKILPMEPGDATALTIRAIAHSQLSMYAEAVQDAEAAIRAESDDDSRLGQWMRSQLPTWRKHAER